MTVCPESFFKTLKREEAYLHDYRTFGVGISMQEALLQHLVTLVRAGARFANGHPVERPDESGGEAQAA